MKRRSFLFVLLGVLLTILGLVLWILPRLPGWERDLVERLANRTSHEYFDDSLRVKKVSLDRYFKIHLEGITGQLKTRQGPVPLEIRSLESQDPLFLFITQKPVHFLFEGLRPQISSRLGIAGNFMIQTGPTPCFELSADLGKTGLEDWQWLDPQNLGGATGAMKGSLTFRQVLGLEPEFSMDLEAPEPGGNIQARFFDLFLPYLPTALQRERVQKVAQSQQLVRYARAALRVNLVQSDNMKILLQIFIPAYNLKLTLNATIRTDEKTAFSQIARLMGLIEVK
ncbi:MAG: hypothetical protein HY767_04085 [Candidatus Omnitrophica bacterium]|nr:hypothetical protein [Candidatus Omnitrophota bacterium]